MAYVMLTLVVVLMIAPAAGIVAAIYRMSAFRKDQPSGEYFGVPYRWNREIYQPGRYLEEGRRMRPKILIAWALYVPWVILGAWIVKHLLVSIWTGN